MPEPFPSGTIPTLFEERVARAPGSVAIDSLSGTISYAGLNGMVNRLARATRSRAPSAEQPVAFLLQDGVEQVLAVLAMFKAGRIAVPLDPSYPPERLRAMLADSRCSLIIKSRSTSALLAELAPDSATLDIGALDAFDGDNPDWAVVGDAWANIYYTSGTTGEPKGVVQTQRNVLRFVKEMARDWRVSSGDRFIQMISCSFSAALLPILVPLLHGATVVPYDIRREGPGQLQRILAERDITVLFCVPSVFRAIAAEGDYGHRPRLCVFTGEPLHWSDVARLRRRFGPGCEAINLFGGSEMHHVASLRLEPENDRSEGIVPAGRPATDKELLLVDERGRPVADGETGELVVYGHHLSPGYWRRPDLTREVFVDADGAGGMRGFRCRDLARFGADGLLTLVGRADSRVKLRGQMVETAAVEAAIAACPGVTEAAVCLVSGEGRQDRLAAYVAIDRVETDTWTALEERLTASLPEFMVPTAFVRVQALPRGPGGKVDRVALADSFASMYRSSEPFRSPRNDVERRVQAVVEQVLGHHPVGVRDDLFDLGLDSLLYADLHVALEHELGRRLPDEVFVHARTVEQLAGSGVAPRARTSGVPGGGQEYGKSWRRLNREMKVRFLAAHFVGLLPPRWSFTGLSRLCRSPVFQRMWSVRGRVAMVCDFLESVRSETSRDAAVARSLRCNYAQPWLLRGIARGAVQDFERAVAVQGLAHFEQAADLNRGVILAVSHFGIPHADLLVLARGGRRDIFTFGSFEYELKLMGLDHLPHVPLAVEPVENFVFRASFLRRAREVLAGGGVVRVAGDGLHGTGGRAWHFHGRARHFRPGVAELAVDTGAPVVPVFGVLSDAGRLEVEFLPALDPPGPAMSRRGAVDACLGQYVRLLERRWAVDPGSVVWEIARSHLEAPPQEEE